MLYALELTISFALGFEIDIQETLYKGKYLNIAGLHQVQQQEHVASCGSISWYDSFHSFSAFCKFYFTCSYVVIIMLTVASYHDFNKMSINAYIVWYSFRSSFLCPL